MVLVLVFFLFCLFICLFNFSFIFRHLFIFNFLITQSAFNHMIIYSSLFLLFILFIAFRLAVGIWKLKYFFKCYYVFLNNVDVCFFFSNQFIKFVSINTCWLFRWFFFIGLFSSLFLFFRLVFIITSKS